MAASLPKVVPRPRKCYPFSNVLAIDSSSSPTMMTSGPSKSMSTGELLLSCPPSRRLSADKSRRAQAGLFLNGDDGPLWNPSIRVSNQPKSSLFAPPSPNHKSSSKSMPNGHHHTASLRTAGGTGSRRCEYPFSDPLDGASLTLQARLAEISSLETETVRWERLKKLKKKSRDD